MKLSYARIVTHDMGALSEFYRELTGIAPVGNEDYRELRSPAGTLAISSQRIMERYGANATTPADNRSVVIEFQVEDVDRERARLRSLVPECVLEPTDQPWGNRSMLFRDPDGNLINFFAPISGA